MRVCQALPKGFGSSFPHSVGAEENAENYTAFTYTPAANAFIVQTAQRAVTAEKLGQRRDENGSQVPDLLAFSFSPNDIVGHAFGPYSPQAIDMMVRTDAMIADFLTFLDDNVGKGKYLVALTGDHGVAPVPEDAASPLIGAQAGRFRPAVVVEFIKDTLTARYGPPAGGLWFSHYQDPRRQLTSNGGAWVDGGIYLSREATGALLASGKVASLRDVEQLVCDAVNSAAIPGIYGCFGKKQILEGRIADNDLRRHLSLGVHPQLSPDLIVLEDQHFLPGEGNTSITNHGTPYIYDTHVPIILYKPGLITPGVFAQRVSTMDIAPTISLLIGTQLPSACDGKPLTPALAQ
jgi:arylsulfatase A-like enzyme